MKKVLVIGSSVSAAFHRYVKDDALQKSDSMLDIHFEMVSINGRAFTSMAKGSPFLFHPEQLSKATLVATETDMDGVISWWPKVKEIELSSLDGVIVTETLLWTMFPKLLYGGFFVYGFLDDTPEDRLATEGKRTPISRDVWIDIIKEFKRGSFELFEFLRNGAPELPVIVAPCAMPRADQTQYNSVFRKHRIREIKCLAELLRSDYGFVVCEQPERTLSSSLATYPEFTMGDIHHYSESFAGEYLREAPFLEFFERVRRRI